jgi:uncharacterized protein YdaU (DUF1376 family)
MLDMHATTEEVKALVDEPTQSRAPYFKFFVDDWRAGTTELTYEQKGLYIDMLCLMWDRKGGLPNDPAEIAKLLGRNPKNIKRLLGELMAGDKPKVRMVRGKLINGRMYKLISEQQKQVEIAAQPRKDNSEKTRRKLPINSELIGNKLPISDPQVPEKKDLFASLPEPKPDPIPEPKKEEPSDDGSLGARKRAKPKRESLDTRLPQDWVLPLDWLEWAEINYAPDRAAVRSEADRFRDYWHAAPGAKGRKRDWFATWRNWCRNAKGAPATLVRRPAGSPGWREEIADKNARMRAAIRGL